MQTIGFFIVVHSKSIIDLYEKTKKYEKLPNYKYLLVGRHESDLAMTKLYNVIGCLITLKIKKT